MGIGLGGGNQQSGGNFWSGLGNTFLGMLPGLGSMIGGHQNERRDYRNRRNLTEYEYQLQRLLNQQGHDLQYDMWRKTNYPAQIQMLKAAGLNPGLMYGMSGGGGTTTGSQTGGSVSAAAAGGQMQPMDVSNMMKVLAETDLLKSQKDNVDKDTILKGTQGAGIKQQIQESIAKETNLKEDTKLKAQQKLNMISEKALTDARTKIENMKFEKGVTGSFLVDLFTQMGLDPMNNTWHRVLINTMVFSWFGAGMMEKIANATTRGMFAKLFGDKSAAKYFDNKAGLDYKSVTQSPPELRLNN